MNTVDTKPLEATLAKLKIHVEDYDLIENTEWDDDAEEEIIDGYFTFCSISVNVLNQTFNIIVQEEPDGNLLVPSNNMIGDMASTSWIFSKDYFALLEVLVKMHYTLDLTEDELEDIFHDYNIPDEFKAADDVLSDHLTELFERHLGVTA